ncbi:MAG: CBS domain-containing protein [Candidatus Hydrogenedentes bacterium]|nr:CBS domain-containing protein [Candidatus Hydrogenedentota bacterium]
MPFKPKDDFVRLTKLIKETGKSRELTVRELLGYFWQERRGKDVTRYMRSKLTSLGVETDPAFDEVHIDSIITLQPRMKRPRGRPPKFPKPTATAKPTLLPTPTPRPRHEKPELEDLASIEESIEEQRRTYLPIGVLEAANRTPVHVRPGDELGKVTFYLVSEGISHLPVLRDSRNAEGIITWESLGKANVGGKPPNTARDCMDPYVRVVGLDTPLFDAVRDIIQGGAILVRAKDNTICGMVTTRTIAEQFVVLSEPFLFLEQIENHLRDLLARARLNKLQLREIVDPSDDKRANCIQSVDGLTFGEYLRALGREDIWKRLNLGFSRKLFVERLDKVREIRNAVMHFHPDGISEGDRDLLAKTREMLQGL